MPKSLKDIIGPRTGRNVSKDELRFLGDLKVDKKEDPAGNKDDVFNASNVPAESSIQKADPGIRHGYRTLKASGKAYEETAVEQKKKKPLTPEDDRNVNGKDYGYSAGAKGGNGSAVAEEQIDELSKETLKSYKEKQLSTKDKSPLQSYNRLVGSARASRKIAQKEKNEEVELDEVLKSSDPASKWISDFVHSKNPKFKGKSKKERIQMALGAKYAKMREEFEQNILESHDDYEGEMAKSQLRAIAAKASAIESMMSDSEDLETWVISKLSRAKHDIDSLHDYLIYRNKDIQTDSKTISMTYPKVNVDNGYGRP